MSQVPTSSRVKVNGKTIERYIGKCWCKTFTRVLIEVAEDGSFVVLPPSAPCTFYRYLGRPCVLCRKCEGGCLAVLVEGEYSSKRRCDHRCLKATSAKCVCSCEGANHGANYSAERLSE